MEEGTRTLEIERKMLMMRRTSSSQFVLSLNLSSLQHAAIRQNIEKFMPLVSTSLANPSSFPKFDRNEQKSSSTNWENLLSKFYKAISCE